MSKISDKIAGATVPVGESIKSNKNPIKTGYGYKIGKQLFKLKGAKKID